MRWYRILGPGTLGLPGSALVLLVLATFGASVGFGLTNWDDDKNLLRNPHIVHFGIGAVGWAWTTFHLGVYQPLGWMLLGLEWRLGGGHPAVVHGTSVLLHGLNAVTAWSLVATLLSRASPHLGSRRGAIAAWWAVAAFSLHPLRAEAVAWASCQPYLPSILFFMLSALSYLRACEPGSGCRSVGRAHAGALSCFVLAVLFKAVAVTLPVLLILLDIYPLRRFGGERGWATPEARRVWREKVPYLIVMAIFMTLAILAKQETKSLVSLANAGWAWRIEQSAYALWFYVGKTVAPYALRAYYPALPFETVGSFAAWVAPAAAGMAAGGLFLIRRRVPWLAAAAAAYLVLLAPNIGLLRAGEQGVADRYSYLASLPWVTLMAAGLSRCLATPVARKTVAAVGSVAIMGLVLVTRSQTATWRDSLSLWGHALAHGGEKIGQVHNNYGAALSEVGREPEASVQYLEGYWLAPGLAATNANVGASLVGQGRPEEALPYLFAAARIEPESSHHHFALGTTLMAAGRREEARQELKAAVALSADDVDSLANLAVVEIALGNEGQGGGLLARVLALAPDHPMANVNTGILLMRNGDIRAAIVHFRRALRSNPRHPDALRLLQDTMVRLRDSDGSRPDPVGRGPYR